MADTASLLEALAERLDGGEDLEMEFKAARNGVPRDVWPTLSAFANTQGGWVLLGATESDAGPVITGVTDASGLLKTLNDMLRNSQKISYPVCGVKDTSVEVLGDKQVILIRVPAAPRRARPVYVSGNVYEGTYVRRHAGDYRCLKPEVDRMMREASDVASDASILPHVGLDDLDRNALSHFRQRCQTGNPADPKNGYDDERFLQAVGGFRHDKETGEKGVTVAGLLMLGTDEAIRQWRPRHLIDFRIVTSEPGADDRWDDRVVWEGHLFGAFEAIYPKLVADLSIPFRLNHGVRTDESQTHVALREALINLLVHADYAETSASLVKRTPQGYLFRNPGDSRVSHTDLLLGDRSDPRNPTLVRMFRFAGLADEAGTGMPKIIHAWRALGFSPPQIDAGSERYEFTLDLRHAHLLAEEDRAWLGRLGAHWSEAEQLALVLARHSGAVDNASLRKHTGQHAADASKVLVQLRGQRLLQRLEGAGWPPRYTLAPAALEAEADEAMGSAQGQIDAERDSQLSIELPASVRANALGDSTNPLGDSAGSLGDLRKSLGDLPPSLEGSAGELGPALGILWEIARMVRESSYQPGSVRDEIIVDLCSVAPLSVTQIAALLGRSPDHIRPILRTLTTTGRLAYHIPERPSHPGQRYVGISGDTNAR